MGDMQCIQVASTDEVAAGLMDAIRPRLRNGGKLLWLISGGSSIPVAVMVSKRLADETTDTTGLFATLVDDIYDTPDDEGHNWHRLMQEGFIMPQGGGIGIARASQQLKRDTAAFDQLLQQKLAWADSTIGQFGIGDDFHTGGIAPQSIAAREHDRLAVGYAYNGQEKITITPGLIARLDVAFVNSLGEAKRPLVAHFLVSEVSPEIEPVQNLKTAHKTYLYSDVIAL